MKIKKPYVLLGTALLCCVSLFSTSGIAQTNTSDDYRPLDSMIKEVRGGFGVKATISNYQLAWGNRPVLWTMTIEGENVWFGTSSGSINAMSAGSARSSVLPPTFGFGQITVTIKVMVRAGQPEEGIISMIQRNGFIIGPLIFLI